MAFNNGDTATAAQAITFAMDFSKSTPAVYTTVCVNSLSEDLGLQTESWVWTGSLLGWAQMCKARLADDAQRETQEFARKVQDVVAPLYVIVRPITTCIISSKFVIMITF